MYSDYPREVTHLLPLHHNELHTQVHGFAADPFRELKKSENPYVGLVADDGTLFVESLALSHMQHDSNYEGF